MADRLDVAADLHVEFDGTDAHLSGSGSQLLLRVAEPVDVFGQLRRAAVLRRPRSAIAAVARELDSAGVTVEVVCADTTLCTIGSGQASRLGAVLVGTRRVTPGRLRPIARILLTAARTKLRTARR